MPSENNFAQTSVVFEAGENLDFLAAKLQETLSASHAPFAKTWVACPPGQKPKVIGRLAGFQGKVEIVEVQSLRHDVLSRVTTPLLAFLPAAAPYRKPNLEDLGTGTPFLRPWVPTVALKENEWARLVYMAFGWIASRDLLQPPLGQESSLALLGLERVSRQSGIHLPYFSAPAGPASGGRIVPRTEGPKLSGQSKILALVPHYRCEEWLEECLDSLTRQTRPLDGIVVLDDASQVPPLEIVKKFKGVTLLRSPQNVGPYRLIQSAIDLTRFDAYLFQDADDWSSLDRLEWQIREAENTGADWVGTQELIYFDDIIHAARNPLAVNPGLKAAIRQSFSHPSGLIRRDLVTRLGGFSSGLRFSGDFEFLSRAVWAGKVANLDRYAYFRRIRKNSLVTSEETGLASSARQKVDFLILKRLAENLVRSDQGLPPLLEPLQKAGPVDLEHLVGPPL